MTRSFVEKEPTYHAKLFKAPKSMQRFQDVGWGQYFIKLDGYHEGLAKEFFGNMRRIDYDSCKTEIKGVSIELNKD